MFDNSCGLRGLYEAWKADKRLKNFARSLEKIRVIWREPDTGSLWGLPYDLLEGQTPYDLFRASKTLHPTRGFLTSVEDWVWLGQPGWWYTYDKHHQNMIKKFLEKHAEHVPRDPCAYGVLPK